MYVPEFYSKFAQIFTIIFIFPGKQITILDSKLRDEIKWVDKKKVNAFLFPQAYLINTVRKCKIQKLNFSYLSLKST